LRQLPPRARLLLAPVSEILAMEAQHLPLHILAHRHGHVGVDETYDRHALRYRWIGEKGIDAGAEHGDELEIGETGEHARRRPPHDGGIDLAGITDRRPNAKIELRPVLAELGLPFFRGIAGGEKENGHYC